MFRIFRRARFSRYTLSQQTLRLSQKTLSGTIRNIFALCTFGRGQPRKNSHMRNVSNRSITTPFLSIIARILFISRRFLSISARIPFSSGRIPLAHQFSHHKDIYPPMADQDTKMRNEWKPSFPHPLPLIPHPLALLGAFVSALISYLASLISHPSPLIPHPFRDTLFHVEQHTEICVRMAKHIPPGCERQGLFENFVKNPQITQIAQIFFFDL